MKRQSWPRTRFAKTRSAKILVLRHTDSNELIVDMSSSGKSGSASSPWFKPGYDGSCGFKVCLRR